AGSKLKGTGVRFSTEGTQGHHPQEGTHVHFQEQLHDSAVMVTQDKDGHFLVKVGDKGTTQGTSPSSVRKVQADTGSPQAPSARSLSPPGHSVRCEYTASKEGVLMEELLLAGHGPQHIKVTIQARVMDRHHGTPMLLDGVRCVAAELEYDSEQSDWPGFD
ncbi:CT027 protein, partial [Sylvia atricapilla]|nr:CT027 protein [Sylvia atricapilla]